MIVIYTGDIDRKKVSARYNIGAVRMNVEAAFLSELDSKKIFDRLKKKVELAVKIQDKKQQIFTLAGILVFTDKVIDRETASRIRRMIEMTQVAQIFEEEKQQAIQKIVTKMIEKGYDTEEITSLIVSYSQNDVEKLRKEITENRI